MPTVEAAGLRKILEQEMTDIWMVLLTLLFFALAIGYAFGCERLR